MKTRILSTARLSFPLATAIAIAALLAAPSASATAFFWDGDVVNGGNPAANANGGTGTWNTTLTNWDTAATAGADTAWTNGNQAVFAGTAGTVTLGAAITVAGNTLGSGTSAMYFTTSGYIVGGTNSITLATAASNFRLNGTTFQSGVTIDLGASRTLTLDLAGTASSIAGVISGTGTSGVTIAGGGTVTLSGTNTYTGGTTVSSGTLTFLNTNAKPASGTHAFAAGTTLGLGVAAAGSFFSSADIDNAFSGTMTGNLSNVTVTATTNVGIDTTAGSFTYGPVAGAPTKGLTKFGINTLTLSGANTHTGLTTVTGGGVLTLAGDNSGMTGGVTLDGTTASTRLNINSDTALGTGTFTISGAGNGSIANSSGATRTLSTNNAQTWGQNFAVVATNSLDIGTGAVTLAATRVVSVSGAVFTVGGVISGAGGIQLGGGIGTLSLTNTASTYTGPTSIGNNSNDTFLRVTKLANLSQPSSLGAPTTAANGLITIGNTSQPGTLELVGTVGTNASSTDRQVRIGGNQNGAGNAAIVNNNTDPANSLIFTNPAFNVSANTSSSSRSLTLGGSNTGANEIQGVIINNINNVGVSVNGSGAWRLSGNNTYDNGTTVSGTATLTLSGDNSGAAGGVTLSTATTTNPPRLNLNSATALGTGTLNFGGGLATDTVRLDNTSVGLVSVSTNNVFTLNRNFTFIGTQSLDLGNMTTTLGGLTTGTSRNITVTANTLTFGGTIGQAAANLGIAKSGAGTLALNNANTFSGNVSINGGTLLIGNAAALGFGGRQTTATGTTTVGSGFTLDLNGAATINDPLILNGTGIGGNGALLNTNTGATAIIGNGIAGIQQSAATNGSGYSSVPTITISGTGSGATATATLGVTALSFTGFSGGDKVYTVAPTVTISGGGGAGATATAVLSGGATGTLTGFTITNAGSGFTTSPTIAFGAGTFSSGTINGSATGNATEFTVSGLSMTAAGSGYTGTPTYTIDSGNATPGSVSLSSVILAADSSIGGAGNITINAVVSESGGTRTLTKVGVGILTLAGANTYGGATTLSAGTLALGANDVLPDATNISIGAATLDAATFDDTLGTLDVTAAATINLGAGANLVFTAATATWAGTLNITGTFVSGSSLRFGTTSGGLTPIQLGQITGIGTVALDANGFLVTAGGNTYATWIGANGPATGFVTDSDNDGLSNGVENVLGSNPNTFNTGLTEVSATATSVVFKHALNPTIASDVTYSYQWSTDMVEWKASGQTNTGGTTATIGASAPVLGVVTVTITITAGPSAKLFGRLVVTGP